MAQTPEGATKARISAVLKRFNCWHFMPVQAGYGAPTLDFHCARHDTREFFMIEAKANKGVPSARQKALIADARSRGIKVFIIDDEWAECECRWESCLDLIKWLSQPA